MMYLLIAITLLTSTGWAKTPKEEFEHVLRISKEAYALASSNRASFRDARMNAITKRIQDDQRVIQETVIDTARMKDLTLKTDTLRSYASQNSDRNEFLDAQKKLSEEMLQVLTESSSPVLKNMELRVQTTLGNIKALRKEN